jgi:hypothetical protein
MNTTKTTYEALNENAKTMETLFGNTNVAIKELYKKQMDSVTDFYTHFLKTSLGNDNPWNLNRKFINLYFEKDWSKWFLNSFSNFSGNNSQASFLSEIDKTMKQVIDLNQNLLSSFTGGTLGKGFNWVAMSEKYKETLVDQIEASKKILDTTSNAFKKQLESSIEINIKATEEISNQYNLVLKQNQKLWSDILKTYHVPHNGAYTTNKESHSHENMKPMKISDHELQHRKS